MDAIRLHVTEPDQAREICGRVYYPHRLTVLHDPVRFAMSLSALNLGPVAVGLLGYAGEVCLETDELETGYEVNVPLSGRLLTSSGPAEVYATPDTAALYPDQAAARAEACGRVPARLHRQLLLPRAGDPRCDLVIRSERMRLCMY